MTTTTTTNGHGNGSDANANRKPAGFIQQRIAARVNSASPDPAFRSRGSAPNRGQFPIPHVVTFQGLASSAAKVYRPSDEAVNASLENARFMRNDVGIMECLEARQRATALLNWHIEPEDEQSHEQRELCEELKKLVNRIPQFLDYRYNLLHALWYGRYAVMHRYRWVEVNGRTRVLPAPHPIEGGAGWRPINGDKLVFRHDDANFDVGQYAGQVGIRVASRFQAGQTINDRHKVEATDRGLAYFLEPWERKLVAIHSHMIEDGAFESITDAGMIHGVGIRSRIYWDWFQKQEALAFLMEYLERSAGGIELWYYDEGNKQAKTKTEEAALQRLGGQRNVILVPRPRGEDAMAYGVEVIEPGMAGIEQLKDLLVSFYGHRIKRYILGQVLSSEAEATGMGSGVAELHLDTFLQIIRYDARKLEETVTQELIEPLKAWNFPSARNIRVRFAIETESPNIEQKLAAWKSAWEMGAGIKERDVMDLIGAAMPGPDDRVLQNPLFQQAAMQQSGAAGQMFGGSGPGQAMPEAVKPQSPEQIAAGMKDAAAQTMYGGDEAQDLDGQKVAYVSEGGDWKEREVPSPEHDTGDRARAERYAKSADEAAAETDREPSDEQRVSGNYRKGKFRAHGLTITIETPKGAERRGTNREGQDWSVVMPCHYGYINRTEGRDGDHVDVFVGPDESSEIVFVVDQTTNGGRFDEHKALMGFINATDAAAAYLGAYSDDAAKRIRDVTAMTVGQFKAWLDEGDTARPLAGQVSRYAKPPAKGQRSLWDEDKHPRESDGTFAEGGGGAAGSAPPPSAKPKPDKPADSGEMSSEESAKYNDYLAMAKSFKLTPRSKDEWLSTLREQQQRFAPKADEAASEEQGPRAEDEPKADAEGDSSAADEVAEPEGQAEDAADAEPEAEPEQKTPQSLFDDAVAGGDTPREAADKADRADDPDYEFARQSSVRNAGEDLKGSARHKVNEWRGLAEAEADGTAEAMVTRDNLLKAEPHGLMNHVAENPMTAMAMHLALKKFPPQPGYGNDRRRSRETEEQKKKDREQYLDAYRSMKDKAEELAHTESDPFKALKELDSHVESLVMKLRGQKGKSYLDRVTATDAYNNTANALVATMKSLGTSAWDAKKSTNVVHHLGLFAKEFSAKYPDLSGEEMHDAAVEHASDVIEGSSVASSFGKSSGKGGGERRIFNSADRYVKHAKRVGGPDISKDSSEPNRATDYMVETLGMRGVQWGNSVTDEERVHHAKNVAEAFADLTDILGIEPADASLGGKLGLAIGARGHGSFAAHYEPGTTVINLTRKSGVGALAHEWGHGFDHMLSGFRTGLKSADFYSERISPKRFKTGPGGGVVLENGKPITEDSSDDPMWKAFDGLRKSWKDSGFKKRLGAAVTSYVHNGILSEAKREYWTSDREVFARTFERYIQRKLEAKGRENTYLSGLAGKEESDPESFWPSNAEVDAMAPHFDAIFEQFRKSKGGSGEPQKYRRDDLVRYFLGEQPNVDRYDRPVSPDAVPESVGKPAAKKGGKGGSWVRLGGGAPAFVGPDGTIKKGCPGLKGENVDDLVDESDESRDRRAAKQAHAEAKGIKGHEVTATETKKWEGQGAQRQHGAAKAAAKRHGVNVADVIQGLPAAYEQRLQQWTQVENARKRARQLAEMNARDLGRAENKYLDHSAIGGFDDIAQSFVAEHPEMGFGRSGDAAAEVWDFIREGVQPKPMIDDDETADIAAGIVGRRQKPAAENQGEGDAGEWESSGADEWEVPAEDDSFDPTRFSKRHAPKPYTWNRS